MACFIWDIDGQNIWSINIKAKATVQTVWMELADWSSLLYHPFCMKNNSGGWRQSQPLNQARQAARMAQLSVHLCRVADKLVRGHPPQPFVCELLQHIIQYANTVHVHVPQTLSIIVFGTHTGEFKEFPAQKLRN